MRDKNARWEIKKCEMRDKNVRCIYLVFLSFILHLALFYLASRIFILHLTFLSRIDLESFFLLLLSRISNVP